MGVCFGRIARASSGCETDGCSPFSCVPKTYCVRGLVRCSNPLFMASGRMSLILQFVGQRSAYTILAALEPGIALDTRVFIYQLGANPRYVYMTDLIFRWLGQPNHVGITSTITITELLVPAYRSSGEAQVDQFYGLLTTYPNLDWVGPNLELADIAARILPRHRLRTPDAIRL